MAIYYPETIENKEIYGTVVENTQASSGASSSSSNASNTSSKSTTDGVSTSTISPTRIIPVILPQVPTANDTIGHSINTKTNKILGSYSFGKVGSLQVGDYVNGTSGDIRISPDGITARNAAGTNTFVIDGQTGDAEFFGTIKAGSLVVGYVSSVGGTYTTTSSTAAKVMLLPDANTGIVAYAQDGATVVFKVWVAGTDVGDVQIGNYAGNNGMLWDNSTGQFTIRGNMTAGAISGTTISGNTISGGTISGTTITGGSISGTTISATTYQTGASGTTRFEINSGNDAINWIGSDNNTRLQIITSSSSPARGIIQTQNGYQLRLISSSGEVNFNGGNLNNIGTVTAGTFSGNVSGGTVSGSHTGTASFSSLSMSGAINMNNQSVNNTDRISGTDGYLDFNSTDIRCSATFVPVSANSQNIGNSGNRWNYLNCVGINKTVGGWGFFDRGVEMQDGTILSDTEALLAMEENTDVLTDYGATTYKPETMPKVIRTFPTCEVCGEIHPKDENGKYFRWVKKKTKDEKGNEIEIDTKVYDVDEGEDVFATISIMLGAIKELAREVKALKSQLNI